MIEGIRLATPEEVERIAKESDLTAASRVMAFEKNLAVIRNCTEVDPVFFDPESPRHKRALFLWGIENILRWQGVPEYYFNVATDYKEFQEDLERLGAERTSPKEEYRYKRKLF